MTNSNENKQQDRLCEIDELLFECQRHNIPAISMTYAQLKALRAAIQTDSVNAHQRDKVLAEDAERGNFRASKKDEPNG
jgi:hypothetical protein